MRKTIIFILISAITLFGYTLEEREPNNNIDIVLKKGYVYNYYPMTINGSIGDKDSKDYFMFKINGDIHFIFKWYDNNFFPVINIYNGNRELIRQITGYDETSHDSRKHVINRRVYLPNSGFYFISIEDTNPIIKKKLKYKMKLITTIVDDLPEKEVIIKLDKDSNYLKDQYYKIMLKDYKQDLESYNFNKKREF